MYEFNNNDITILRSVINKSENRGTCRAKGSTIVQIAEKSELSTSKVQKSIRKLKAKGWVDEGVRIINTKTYYITESGIKELADLSRSVI